MHRLISDWVLHWILSVTNHTWPPLKATVGDSTKIMSVLACMRIAKSPSKKQSGGLRRMTHYEVLQAQGAAESIENAAKQMADFEACTPHTTGIFDRSYVWTSILENRIIVFPQIRIIGNPEIRIFGNPESLIVCACRIIRFPQLRIIGTPEIRISGNPEPLIVCICEHRFWTLYNSRLSGDPKIRRSGLPGIRNSGFSKIRKSELFEHSESHRWTVCIESLLRLFEKNR